MISKDGKDWVTLADPINTGGQVVYGVFAGKDQVYPVNSSIILRASPPIVLLGTDETKTWYSDYGKKGTRYETNVGICLVDSLAKSKPCYISSFTETAIKNAEKKLHLNSKVHSCMNNIKVVNSDSIKIRTKAIIKPSNGDLRRIDSTRPGTVYLDSPCYAYLDGTYGVLLYGEVAARSSLWDTVDDAQADLVNNLLGLAPSSEDSYYLEIDGKEYIVEGLLSYVSDGLLSSNWNVGPMLNDSKNEAKHNTHYYTAGGDTTTDNIKVNENSEIFLVRRFGNATIRNRIYGSLSQPFEFSLTYRIKCVYKERQNIDESRSTDISTTVDTYFINDDLNFELEYKLTYLTNFPAFLKRAKGLKGVYTSSARIAGNDYNCGSYPYSVEAKLTSISGKRSVRHVYNYYVRGKEEAIYEDDDISASYVAANKSATIVTNRSDDSKYLNRRITINAVGTRHRRYQPSSSAESTPYKSWAVAITLNSADSGYTNPIIGSGQNMGDIPDLASAHNGSPYEDDSDPAPCGHNSLCGMYEDNLRNHSTRYPSRSFPTFTGLPVEDDVSLTVKLSKVNMQYSPKNLDYLWDEEITFEDNTKRRT